MLSRQVLALVAVFGGCVTSPAGSVALVDRPMPRAINGRSLPPRAAGDPWSFLLGGHVYGTPNQPHALADTLVRARERLGDPAPDLWFLAGDTYRSCGEPWLTQVDAFLAAVDAPVFNAPGNHDLHPRAEYERRHGATYGAFVHGGCAFVQLDTEAAPWEIEGEQLGFLGRALDAAARRRDVHTIFCIGHKLVFSHRRRYFPLLLGANAHDGLHVPNRFGSDVLPLLAAAARRKAVYWVAGDIGLGWSLPFFLDRDPASGVNFVAIGLGARAEDLFARVHVGDESVQFELVGLDATVPGAPSAYGLEAWNEHFQMESLPAAVAAYWERLPD